MTLKKKDAVVGVRLAIREAQLVRDAARLEDRTLSSYIRRALLQAADHTLAATAASTGFGPFCRPTSGQNDQPRVPTP